MSLRTLVALAGMLAFTACARRLPCASSALLEGGPPVLDARFSVASCCAGPTYAWNGRACVGLPPATLCGCACAGRDCDKVFSSREQCERAYQHCG